MSILLKEDLASIVSEIRKQRGLTVQALAERSGVSASYIYAIESGARGSAIEKLSAIFHSLGMKILLVDMNKPLYEFPNDQLF